LWPQSTADPNGPGTITDLGALAQLVIWPKLFRRLVPYLAGGFADFNSFDAWLQADPINRDDELFVLDKAERPPPPDRPGRQLALGEDHQLGVHGGADQVDEGHHGRDVAQYRVARTEPSPSATSRRIARRPSPSGRPALQAVLIGSRLPAEARNEAASTHRTCWTGATVMSRPASSGPPIWAAE
jgi:hypothetical protein